MTIMRMSRSATAVARHFDSLEANCIIHAVKQDRTSSTVSTRPGRNFDRRPPAIRNLARSVPIFAVIRTGGNPNDTYHRLRQASLDFHRGLVLQRHVRQLSMAQVIIAQQLKSFLRISIRTWLMDQNPCETSHFLAIRVLTQRRSMRLDDRRLGPRRATGAGGIALGFAGQRPSPGGRVAFGCPTRATRSPSQDGGAARPGDPAERTARAREPDARRAGPGSLPPDRRRRTREPR